MRNWVRRTLFGLLGASIVFGGLAACSHRHDHGWSQASAEDREKMRGKVIERLSSRLELNAEQKRLLGVLADKLEAQRAALASQNGLPRQAVRTLVATNTFDRAKAQSLVSEKTAAVNAKSPEVIAALGDFYDSLDAKQQQKVRDFMERKPRHWWRSS